MAAKLDIIVLGLLAQKPMHGYHLAEFFRSKGIHNWMSVKKTSVYKALNRLEEKKYISGEYETDKGKQPRKVFNITPEGKNYLRKILKDYFFSKKFSPPPEFLYYLRFAKGNLTQKEFILAIENRIKKNRIFKKRIKEKRKEAVESGLQYDLPFYGHIVEEMMNKFLKIGTQSLVRMKEEAKLPKNKNVFYQED